MIAAAPSLILLYHRVAETSRDPQNLCVSPQTFAAHLDWLSQAGIEIVPLHEILRHGSRPRVALTFDDGYADNAHHARPILEEKGAPATVFVVAGMVGSRSPFWWDELEEMLLGGSPIADQIDLEIEGRRVVVDVRSVAGKERAYWTLHRRLRPLPQPAIASAMEALRRQVGPEPGPGRAPRCLTLEELISLRDSTVVELGSHTVSHPLLKSLAREEQQAEIAGSRERLEQMLGRRVDLFSYPYGGLDAFDRTTARLVSDAGYVAACSGLSARVSRRSDRFALPRVVVHDWGREKFEAQLARRLRD